MLHRYGTSIQQGGVASRAGNLYDAILGRRLSREVLNFGFAGNGHEDIGVAKYLGTLPAAVIMLDCLPNMNAATVAAKTVPVVKCAPACPPAPRHCPRMAVAWACAVLALGS